MTLTKGKGSVIFSYIGSSYFVHSALFDCTNRAVVLHGLLLFKMTTNTGIKTTTVAIRAAARERMDIIYTAVSLSKFCMPIISVVSDVCIPKFSVGLRMFVGVCNVDLVGQKSIVIGSLILPVIFPQTTV